MERCADKFKKNIHKNCSISHLSCVWIFAVNEFLQDPSKLQTHINGMLRHSLEGAVIFISLQHFIAPALYLMPCLQAQGTMDCNKGIKFKKGAIKSC